MNMKRINALIVGTVLASALSAQEREWELPKPEQVGVIEMETTPTLWRGTFYPNGSARLDYGGAGDPNPQKTAPEGSFSFEKVYNLLTPLLKPERDGREDTHVVFFMSGTKMYGGFIKQTEENKKVVRALMHELADKATVHVTFHSEDLFEELLATKPFILGDEPFARDEKARRISGTSRPPMTEAKGVSEQAQPTVGEASKIDTTPKEPVLGQGEGGSQTPSRLWLYVGILFILCIGTALWRIRRKR